MSSRILLQSWKFLISTYCLSKLTSWLLLSSRNCNTYCLFGWPLLSIKYKACKWISLSKRNILFFSFSNKFGKLCKLRCWKILPWWNFNTFWLPSRIILSSRNWRSTTIKMSRWNILRRCSKISCRWMYKLPSRLPYYPLSKPPTKLNKFWSLAFFIFLNYFFSKKFK